MVSTQSSRRAVFRRIARTSYYEWPAYSEKPFYDRSSPGGLEEGTRVVASVWFEQDGYDSLEDFVCHWPLANVKFEAHDRFTGQTRYGMEALFRAFFLKELHGWDHETALCSHLENHPSLRERLGFGTLPDQSTLWRSWQYRFTTDLRDCLETATRTILFKQLTPASPCCGSHPATGSVAGPMTMRRPASLHLSGIGSSPPTSAVSSTRRLCSTARAAVK